MGQTRLTPTVYQLVEEVDTGGEYVRGITLERCKQRDGSYKWAIRSHGQVMTKTGKWEYEPMPSSRTDAFLKRARFDSVDEAVWTFRVAPNY
jgi:hypothetical protein